MKIAIISDTHDNLPNIEKVINHINKQSITEMIHCGDVCAPYTMVQIAKKFIGNINLCLGNVDGDPFRMLQEVHNGAAPNVTIHQEIGEFKLAGKKIAINHFPDIATKLAKSGEYDIVFYGHSHKPWEEMINVTRLVNPGNVANLVNPPSFAIYDTESDELELILVNEL